MTTTFIYALCEPGTQSVRYIGKTGNLKTRFRQHLWQSIRLPTLLGEWLRSLSAVDKKPVLVELDRVPISQGLESEKRFIRLALDSGISLVNGNLGGGGPVFHSPETREKMMGSHSNSGENCSLETRAKLRASRLGKSNSPESCAKTSATLSGKKRGPYTTQRNSEIEWALIPYILE